MIAESCQIQHLQGRPAGWRPRDALQFQPKGNLLKEFFLFIWREQAFSIKGLQLIR